jgi:S1-C subfamily serine protease
MRIFYIFLLITLSINSFSQTNLPDLTSEQSIRDYFDENGADSIEGLYFLNAQGKNQYKVAVLKETDFVFKMYIVENYVNNVKPGYHRATIKTTTNSQIFELQWESKKKKYRVNTIATLENSLIKFNLKSDNVLLVKTYPASKQKTIKTGEWAGNGSGIIISKSGHIITNHHVIDDADKIEVEFMLNDELQKFNAEVVQVDKVNDLAVLKIFDMDFNGIVEPPYNFKFRGSDVGTKVYAFGYPLALSIMGKELKVTDGMISSKTGFDGDITTYQITAPIQGGNSGGPLFDEQANLIGINSSGIRKDIAANVAYSIKTSYVSNLIDVLPKSIELPSSKVLESLSLTEQIKEISKYVVLVKVK